MLNVLYREGNSKFILSRFRKEKKNNMCGRVKTNAVVFKVKFSCDCFTFNPFHIYVKFMFAFQTLQHV